MKNMISPMVDAFCEIFNMSQWPASFENNQFFINTQEIFTFNVFILMSYVRNIIQVMIPCFYVSLNILTVWLQLHTLLIAFDHITTRENGGSLHSCVTTWGPGARLTKANDVTIQRYRNSHAKIEDRKCIFCGVWVQNFVWNFKGALWNFTQNFEPISPQNMNFRRYQKLDDLWS